MEIDLNAPAFGDKAQKVEQPAPLDEVKPEVEVKPESLDEEEGKVKYSRFKSVNDKRREAEAEAEKWKAEADRLRSEREPQRESFGTDEIPSFWKEMYGETEQSKKAWKLQKQHDDEVLERAEKRAREAVQDERSYESKAASQNLDALDENLEALSDFVGRELTEREQSRILDIVDDYTPKDDDGNYAGPVIPFEKAWKIYELENQNANAPRTRTRNAIASASAGQSQGEASISEEKNKSFNPSWGALGQAIKERIG